MPSTLVILVLFLLMMMLMSSFARRQQRKLTEQQAQQRDEALVEGNWVRTTAGFYGRVVEVDGDVVTLSTPLGDETLWQKRAIVCAEEPPFASTQDEMDVAAVEEPDMAEDALRTDEDREPQA
ncbi:preprotein translocase subunit YajC [Actinomyces vulturis]|uniref:preprotein translocase subunit YajC n=1 Tax=Actinomyces vulturis TaxID=1857645 RepID=UPI000832FB29|nr:preprotein translocase subunit YajC [Actinomyces vulturis]